MKKFQAFPPLKVADYRKLVSEYYVLVSNNHHRYPEISVIIANYNGGEKVLECLYSIERVADTPIEIVFVDAASNDGSFERALSLLSESIKERNSISLVKVIRLKKNYGPCIAYNIGVLYSSASLCLIMNNDVILSDNFSFSKIENIMNYLRKKRIAGIMVKVCKISYRNVIDTAGTILDRLYFTWEIGQDDRDDREYSQPYYVHSVPLVFACIVRDVIIEAGLLDPLFFAGYEDLDLSLRIWFKGYRLLYLPLMRVYHYRGYTSQRKALREKIAYYFARNHIINIIVFEPGMKFVITLFTALLLRFIASFCLSVYRKSAKYLLYLFIKPVISVSASMKYVMQKRLFVKELKERCCDDFCIKFVQKMRTPLVAHLILKLFL